MGKQVFVTGGTGYIGQRLVPLLVSRGHVVRALVRSKSRARLPQGCEAVIGDALDSRTFAGQISPSTVFIQLVGISHPSPAKAEEFKRVDLASVRASVAAATTGKIEHFIYVSVAQPAPVMAAYVRVRAEGEDLIRRSGMPATILRPWYVLGPGHRWPYLLLPIYSLAERLPATREGARRLRPVRLQDVLTTLVSAVESEPSGVRIVEATEIAGGS
ncbi:MAG: NAD(P)H-binding protein, partial [Acidobacteriota bacterium]